MPTPLTLLQALINQGHDLQSARTLIREMCERVLEGEDPEELLAEEGLEPDYVMDILPL